MIKSNILSKWHSLSWRRMSITARWLSYMNEHLNQHDRGRKLYTQISVWYSIEMINDFWDNFVQNVHFHFLSIIRQVFDCDLQICVYQKIKHACKNQDKQDYLTWVKINANIKFNVMKVLIFYISEYLKLNITIIIDYLNLFTTIVQELMFNPSYSQMTNNAYFEKNQDISIYWNYNIFF